MCPRYGLARYWSADTLFRQVSIDHNMDAQYQTERPGRLLAGVWPPCCVVVVGRTRPGVMPLSMLTVKKELHGFLVLSMHMVLLLMVLRLAAFRADGGPQLCIKRGNQKIKLDLLTKILPLQNVVNFFVGLND